MQNWDNIFEPSSDEDIEAHALEALIFAIQIKIQEAMTEHGLSNKGLAERLGCSPARVTQYFSSAGPNLTVKTLVKILHALDDEWVIERKSKQNAKVSRESVRRGFPSNLEAVASSVSRTSGWKVHPSNDACNDNLAPEVLAA